MTGRKLARITKDGKIIPELLTDSQKKLLKFNSILPIDPSILRENIDDLKTTISTLCKQYAGVQEELVNLSAQYDEQEKLLEKAESKLAIAIQALEDLQEINRYSGGDISRKALDKIRGEK